MTPPAVPPEGYEFTGEFRVPLPGDSWYARTETLGSIGLIGADATPDGPRWILRQRGDPA